MAIFSFAWMSRPSHMTRKCFSIIFFGIFSMFQMRRYFWWEAFHYFRALSQQPPCCGLPTGHLRDLLHDFIMSTTCLIVSSLDYQCLYRRFVSLLSTSLSTNLAEPLEHNMVNEYLLTENASIFSELNWAVQSGVNGKLESYHWNESVEFDSNGNINHAPSTTKELRYILSFLIYSFHPIWLTHYINPVLLDIIFMLIEKRKICKDNTTVFAPNCLLYVKRNSQNFDGFFCF